MTDSLLYFMVYAKWSQGKCFVVKIPQSRNPVLVVDTTLFMD